jgi:beta-glucosidase
MVGYRWYDSQHLQPAFPFGFGLSYTRFRFSGLTIKRDSGPHTATVAVTVKNVGSRTGSAMPELYVSMPSLPSVPEPPWQLKGFAKVPLAPGQSRRIGFPLDARSFSYWSTASGGWQVARGCDAIAVGSSSRDLPLRGVVSQSGAACAGRR